MTAYASIAGRLRELRAAAGNPSYTEIVRRIRDLRARRGVPPAEQAPGRVTVYDCFKPVRSRFDVDLVVDIGRALGLDDDDAREWERTCWAVQHRGDESRIVSARTTLPKSPVRFVARADELRRLLPPPSGPPPVYVVHGMAGCGKTELVCEAARRLLAAGAVTQVVFADLRGFAADRPPVDPAAMLDAIVRSLGADPYRLGSSRRDRQRAYGRLLAERRAALILDDVKSAAQVKQLIPGNEGAKVFVTSRAALPAIGGVDIALDVLSTADAVTFLRDAVGSAVDVSDSESIVRLVEAVGNLPLALSVIASRMVNRPEWTLTDHVGSLTGPDGRVRLDQQVRSVLDQSHEALSPQARRTLRLVASLPFDDLGLDSTAALSGSDPSTTAAVTDELVDASMAVRPGTGRLGLHALVREHARDRSLDEDRPAERTAAMAALADHLASNCRAAAAVVLTTPAESRYAVTTAPLDFDDETAAAWLVAEFENLLIASSDACRTARPTVPIELSEALSAYVERRGLHRDGILLHGQAVVAAGELGDRLGEGLAETARAQCHLRLAETERGAEGLRRAEHLLAGEWLPLLRVKNALAVLAYQAGDLHASVALLRDAAEATSEANLPRDSSIAHANIAVILRRLGDGDGAVEHLDIAHERAVAAGDVDAAATALSSLSDVHLSRRDVAAALDAVTRSLQLCEAHELVHLATYARSNLGLVLVALGRPEEAIQEHLGAIDDARSVGDRHGELAALNNLGEAYLASQRNDDAGGAFAGADRLAVELDDAFERGRALAGIGRVALALGDLAGARNDLQASLAHFEESIPEAAAVRAALAALAALAEPAKPAERSRSAAR